MHKKQLNTLHIDIENGFGGSSRSLSYLLKALNDKDINPTVWIARPGPALKRNKKNKIKCRINNNISYLIPVKKNNIANFIISIPRIFKLYKLAKEIKNTQHDLLHLNHEGLLLLAFILRVTGYKKKIVIHKRGIIFKNYFSKAYFKLSKYVDAIIFISENEKKNFFQLVKNANIKNEIIFNSFDRFKYKKTEKSKKNYNAIYLGSFNHYKAPDRILDLAYQTKLARLPIKYKIFGKENKKKYFFKRNDIDTGFLNNKIQNLDISDVIELKGQTENPEVELIKSDILIRPSRKNDNWGRDIIEAMSLGKFIISTGFNDLFIKNNQNGIVVNKWEIKKLINIFKYYLKNIEKFNQVKLNANLFAKKNFNADKNANKVRDFFYSLF